MNRILQNGCTLASSLLLLASCSQGALSDLSQGAPLPEGMYPLEFSSGVEGQIQTRASVDNSWTGGEEVAVQTGGEVKKYTAGSDGSLAAADAANTFYWQTSDETKSVTAWYPYSAASPTTWAVKDNQSGTGYQGSDLLYAPQTSIGFIDTPKQLTFYHQTAKVVINIVNADAATAVGDISSVSLVNMNTTADYTAPTGNSITTGTWSNPTTVKQILPKEITASGYLASYAALVIPQDMDGQQFIALTLSNGNTYYYTPQGTDANLQSGKVHTYDITVKHGYLEVVTAEVSGEWGGGGETSVTGKEVKAGYTAADLKIGDYYYSDGSTSDGGLRWLYSDGTFLMESVQPDAAKTVLGIVMKVGKDDSGDWLDTDSYKQKDGTTDMTTIHGYVLALYDAGGGEYCRWGAYGTWVGTNIAQYTPFCGYSNTRIITLQTDIPAAYHATDGYESSYPAPAHSSGWFLPSAGQCKYWWNNRDVLQASMVKAKGSNSWGEGYWSSSECSFNPDTYAWLLNSYSSDVEALPKDHLFYVRSCLAF